MLRVACQILLCLSMSCTYAYALVHNGKIDMLKAKSTEETIQIVRGLKFKSPIQIVAKTKEQVGKMLGEREPGDATDEQIEADGEAGAMMGLFPPNTHLKAVSLRMLEGHVLAFYDFTHREMVVVEGTPAGQIEGLMERAGMRDMLGYMILAHEFTHALQDQHFNLGASLRKLQFDSDRELALRSVCEGDATLAGWDYMLGGMDHKTLTMLENHIGKATNAYVGRSKGTPLALYASMVFPYTAGLRFVAEAYRRGGWAAVNALYKNPPQSTQQIMDPSLYFDHPTLPVDIRLSGYKTILDGWRVIEGDRYGELGLQLILQRNLGMHSPEVGLAKRWAGDQMEILGRHGSLTVLWMVVFRDARSAARFARVYAKVLSRTPGARHAYRIGVRANAILIVAGGAAKHFARLEPAIWKDSVIHQPATPGKGQDARSAPVRSADAAVKR